MLSSLLSLFLVGTAGAAIPGDCLLSSGEKTPCTFVSYSCGRVRIYTEEEALTFRQVFFSYTEVTVSDGSTFTDQCVMGENSLNCLKTLTFISK